MPWYVKQIFELRFFREIDHTQNDHTQMITVDLIIFDLKQLIFSSDFQNDAGAYNYYIFNIKLDVHNNLLPTFKVTVMLVPIHFQYSKK